MIRSILVLQSGGPSAVMNATLGGLLEGFLGQAPGVVIWGARWGVQGLSDGDWIRLDSVSRDALKQLRSQPGPALGSARMATAEVDLEAAARTLTARGVDGVVVIGGNGSMELLMALSSVMEHRVEGGIQLLGLPKTVDNDVAGTDHAPGYGSAARFVARAVQESDWDLMGVRTEEVRVIELMGRNAGWLAAAAVLGMRGCDEDRYHMVLPERPFVRDAFLDGVEKGLASRGQALIVVAEGARRPDGELLATEAGSLQRDDLGRPLPGFSPGAGHVVAETIRDALGRRVRYEKPGVLQRTGLETSSVDRAEAHRLGRSAVSALLRGESGTMLGFERRSGKYGVRIASVPLGSVAGQERRLPDAFFTGATLNAARFSDYVRPLIGAPLPDYAMLWGPI